MKDRIVVHVCCGICAIKTIEFIKNDFEPIGYWYNPNIHPYNEYKLRLQTAGYVFQRLKTPIEWDFQYNIIDWFTKTLPVAHDKSKRCSICYEMRLEKTALFSRNLGIKIFTTTMFSSIHQDLELIKEKGKILAARYNLEFLPLDLKQFYQEGKSIAKKWHLYSQRYCGCFFSELEREGIINEDIKRR